MCELALGPHVGVSRTARIPDSGRIRPPNPTQLFREGADPNTIAARGRGTALHEAVAARQEAAVEVLLTHRFCRAWQ